MRRSKHSHRELPLLWRPRRDPLSYVIAALIVVLELPVLAVIALGALVARAGSRISASGGARNELPGDLDQGVQQRILVTGAPREDERGGAGVDERDGENSGMGEGRSEVRGRRRDRSAGRDGLRSVFDVRDAVVAPPRRSASLLVESPESLPPAVHRRVDARTAPSRDAARTSDGTSRPIC
jgi:hypothetical protein